MWQLDSPNKGTACEGVAVIRCQRPAHLVNYDGSKITGVDEVRVKCEEGMFASLWYLSLHDIAIADYSEWKVSVANKVAWMQR